MGQGNRRVVGGQVVVATKDDVVFVGLDVHVKSFHVAIWKNGQIVWQGVIPARAEVLIKLLAGVRAGLKKVVYEAGPTGYVLARALAKEGLPVEVAAPSEIKRKSGKEAKKAPPKVTRVVNVNSHFLPNAFTIIVFCVSFSGSEKMSDCPPCTNIRKTSSPPSKDIIIHQ